MFWKIGLLLLLSLLALFFACMAGQYPVSAEQAATAFLQFFGFLPVEGSRQETLYSVIINIRLARNAAAMFCGASLALAGVILQAVLRNPLADPFTLGISAGAACGASLAIAFGALLFQDASLQTLVCLASFAGSLIALCLALVLGHSKGGVERESVILAGMAVAAFLGAVVALVKALNEESVTSIVFWIMGSLQGATWNSLGVLSASFLPGVLVAFWGWRRLDILGLGDEQARWLGMNPAGSRLLLLFGASAMTAGCVATSGIIGFVGLVCPHILRLILGPAHGLLLAAALPAGALFLLFSDCIARVILDGGQELPVGVVTAILGAPLFAWLIWKRKPE